MLRNPFLQYDPGGCDVGIGRNANNKEITSAKRLRQAFSCGPSTIRLLTWCAILNCGFCGLAFAGDLASANPRSAGHVPEVPFKLYQGYVIVVLGRIGNLENQNLLLDTGGYPSLVDKNVCTKLGLQGTPKRLSLFNKNISSEVVLLPDLQFGPVTRRNLPVMVADFAGISGGLRIRIDAVIGVDVLGGTSFTVDYEKHRVLFRPSTERYTVSFYGARAVRNGESKDGWPPTTAAPRYRNAAARLVSEPTEWALIILGLLHGSRSKHLRQCFIWDGYSSASSYWGTGCRTPASFSRNQSG